MSPWQDQFDAWWSANRVKQVLNPGGFARMVWETAVKSVPGATDSTAGFYPADEGSTPSGHANTPGQTIQRLQAALAARNEEIRVLRQLYCAAAASDTQDPSTGSKT